MLVHISLLAACIVGADREKGDPPEPIDGDTDTDVDSDTDADSDADGDADADTDTDTDTDTEPWIYEAYVATDAVLTMTGEGLADYSGGTVDFVGDMDGDGLDDLAIGATGDDDGS